LWQNIRRAENFSTPAHDEFSGAAGGYRLCPAAMSRTRRLVSTALLVCGFGGTWFVGAADIFPELATMVGRKCSSF
jgi:hypothetical protein